MTRPIFSYSGGARGASPASHTRRRARPLARFVRGRRRRWMLISLLSFWLALTTMALPLESAHADPNSLSSYGAIASGWGMQPFVANDSFQNVPAADQAAPYVYVSMDNTPGAEAKASYFFPGTAINAVPNTQGVSVAVPNGMEARFPGNGSATSQAGGFNDGVTTQAAAGSQSAKASEGYALAQAAIASYQFAPAIPSAPQPPGVPGVPSAPTPPPLSSPTALPTTTSGGSSPTATPGSGGSATPTPSPTPCFIVCFPGASSSSHGGVDAAPSTLQPAQGLPPVTLPDIVEQQLTAALKAAQTANPSLLALAGNQLAAPDPTLPYASADMASQAETRATGDGVTVVVQTHAQKVELFQGLITFASVESNLQASAPGSQTVKGSGTITTTVTGATVASIPVTVDQHGVTVATQNLSVAQAQTLTDQLNAALAKAHVHISLMTSVISTDVGAWQGSGSGVEVTAGLNSADYNAPPPANGVPTTHVDFSISSVSANIYASPGDTGSSTGSGGGFFGGGSGGFGYGGYFSFDGSNGGSSGSSSAPAPAPKLFGKFALPSGLQGLPLLSLVFVIQGLSTAAVAAAGGYTSPEGASGAQIVEEETQ